MPNPGFSRVLIPVDFGDNSRIAISKALELMNAGGMIHLFHVHGILYSGFTEIFHHAFHGYSQRDLNIEKLRTHELLEWMKEDIEAIRPDIDVTISCEFGKPIEEAIADAARAGRAELIVIGKNNHHPFFPFLNTVVPSRLTSRCGVSVFTVKRGSINQAVNQVVVPVGCQFPERKLEILESLHVKYKLHVRLVVFQSDINRLTFPLQYLVNKLKMLRNNRILSVEHEILKGSDKARALIRFCKKVGADMLIVQPGAETRTKRWPGCFISDLIPPASRTQVLSIRPL